MPEFTDFDYRFMEKALDEARSASAMGEVPIGAVLVDSENTILSAAGNRPISHSDPSAHAEIVALRLAGERLSNYRLLDTTLYVTLEPCLMCMGAMIHARVKRLVFGAVDPKTGAAISRYSIGRDKKLNHTLEIEHGLYAKESSEMLKAFFKNRRNMA